MVYSRENRRQIELTLDFSDVNPLIPCKVLYKWEMRHIGSFNRLYGGICGTFNPHPSDKRGKTKLSVRHGVSDKKALEWVVNLGSQAFCIRAEVFWLEEERRDRVVSKMKESKDGSYLFAEKNKKNDETMNAKPCKIWLIDENVDYLERSDRNRVKVGCAERAKARLKGVFFLFLLFYFFFNLKKEKYVLKNRTRRED